MSVGMGGISPTALQQGLMMAQAQQTSSSFQPALIHPSLQTPQDHGKGEKNYLIACISKSNLLASLAYFPVQ